MRQKNCTKFNYLLQAIVAQAAQGPGQDLKLTNNGPNVQTHWRPMVVLRNNRPHQDNTLDRATAVPNRKVVPTKTTPAPKASAQNTAVAAAEAIYLEQYKSPFQDDSLPPVPYRG